MCPPGVSGSGKQPSFRSVGMSSGQSSLMLMQNSLPGPVSFGSTHTFSAAGHRGYTLSYMIDVLPTTVPPRRARTHTCGSEIPYLPSSC